MSNKTKYLKGPKLVTIYRHVGSYEEIIEDGNKIYRVLFRKSMNGDWRTVDVTEREVAAFVDMEDDTELNRARSAYPDYLVQQLPLPTSLNALDSQLQDFGEGFNSSWSSYEVDGHQLGFLNKSLQVLALYSREDMALRKLRYVEAEPGGFRFQGIDESHQFSRISPSVWGAAPMEIDTLDEAQEFASVLLAYRQNAYSREVLAV
ncbi:hypothetical protein F7U66_01510 [Vibrio parahaemolyticus]|nr:hypothetical protein [Vibrio parahaemolyticus]